MRCIALWQPWASLWLTERKIHETRHWETMHRGWIAVHAAKKFVKIHYELGKELVGILDDEFGSNWTGELPTGAIIGAVNLVSCLHMIETAPAHNDDLDSGNWSDERYAWRRGEFIKLRDPIPYIGRQGIFTLPDDISAQILNPALAA